MSTIVKIQKDPKAALPSVTLHNECRTIQLESPMTPELEKHLKDKDLIFAKVSFAANRWRILGLVKKQNW